MAIFNSKPLVYQRVICFPSWWRKSTTGWHGWRIHRWQKSLKPPQQSSSFTWLIAPWLVEGWERIVGGTCQHDSKEKHVGRWELVQPLPWCIMYQFLLQEWCVMMYVSGRNVFCFNDNVQAPHVPFLQNGVADWTLVTIWIWSKDHCVVFDQMVPGIVLHEACIFRRRCIRCRVAWATHCAIVTSPQIIN